MSGGPIRILRLLPTLGTGGTEKQCLEVLAEFVRLAPQWPHMRVDLATLYEPLSETQLPAPASIELIALQQPRTLAGLLAGASRLQSLLAHYDLVHAMLWPSVWAVALAHRATPLVASVHGTELRAGPLGLKAAADRFMFKRARRLVFNSASGRQQLAARLGWPIESCDVIGNGKPLYEGPWPPRRGVICLARVQHPKRQDLLLDAWQLMPSDRRPTLRFFGQQTQDEQFLAQLAQRGLPPESARGELTEPLPEIAAAEILALPSDNEGTPNAILEAWSTRTPVIASAAPGIRELVRHDVDGLLVENKPQAWADGLARLLADAALRDRLADAGYERLRAEFSLPAVATAWVELYIRTISQARG